MTILDAIREVVGAGSLREPFSLAEATAALQSHGFWLGGLQAALSRHSRGAPTRPAPPIRRGVKGRYRSAPADRNGPGRRALNDTVRRAP